MFNITDRQGTLMVEGPDTLTPGQKRRVYIYRTADHDYQLLANCIRDLQVKLRFEREWYLRGDVLNNTEYWLGSLLAVIHRDGGHYQAEHGTTGAEGLRRVTYP